MMNNRETLITQENLDSFKASGDALTGEPFQIGERAVRCAACKRMFHAELVKDGACPACGEAFEGEEIVPPKPRTGERPQPKAQKARISAKTRRAERTWAEAPRAGLADHLARWLTVAAAVGVAASVLLIFAGSAHGWLPGLNTLFSDSSELSIPGQFKGLLVTIQALVTRVAVPQLAKLWQDGISAVRSGAVWIWKSLSKTVVETADGAGQALGRIFG